MTDLIDWINKYFNSRYKIDNISCFKDIETLELKTKIFTSDNPIYIKELHPNFNLLENLKTLKIINSKHNVFSIDVINLNLPNLNMLQLHGLGIKTFKVNSYNLRILDLTSNNLEAFSLNHKELRILNLSNNLIEKLSINCPKIRTLCINNNLLKNPIINHLQKIDILYVDKNIVFEEVSDIYYYLKERRFSPILKQSSKIQSKLF